MPEINYKFWEPMARTRRNEAEADRWRERVVVELMIEGLRRMNMKNGESDKRSNGSKRPAKRKRKAKQKPD